MSVLEAILNVFRSINTTVIEMFDERYASISDAAVAVATTTIAAARLQGRGSFQYRDFSNTMPLEFDRIKDPIIAMRWLSDVAGCFFTCSCSKEQKVGYILNFLFLGA